MKKKYIAIVLMLALSCVAFAGCAGNKKEETPQAPETSENANQAEQKPEPNSDANQAVPANVNESEKEEKNNQNKKNSGKIDRNNGKTAKNKSEGNKSEAGFKKLSGKFSLCVPEDKNSDGSKEEKELRKALIEGMKKVTYEFKGDGTVFIGTDTPQGPIGVPGKFTQTADKLVISSGDTDTKEEFSYTYDGNTLKLIDPKSKNTITLVKKG